MTNVRYSGDGKVLTKAIEVYGNFIVPNGVTEIGKWAFSGCSNLKAVINLSELDIVCGSKSNGYVAYCPHFATSVQRLNSAIMVSTSCMFRRVGG